MLLAQQNTIWFVLSEGHSGLEIDPLGKVVGSKIVGVPLDCDPENAEYKKFEAAYLRLGETYSVRFGGAPAGIIGLRGPDPKYGNETVEYDGVAHIHGILMALATNAELPSSENSSRQSPSAEERKFALQLANESFAAKGFGEQLRQKITIENLTHTTLGPDRLPVLVGSIALPLNDDSGLIHGFFFIASETDGKPVPEFQWMHISQAEAGSELLRLVDQADLFGDGQEELVAVLTYYENYRYRVYRRLRDKPQWEQIFETEVLGCL